MGLGWIYLDVYREKWWAVVNSVMYLWVSLNAGNVLTN